MQLLPHQQLFVDTAPDKVIQAWSTRAGKSYAICGWMKKRQHINFILVCPLKAIGVWEQNFRVCGVTNCTITTFERIKKLDLTPFTGLVVDECHRALSHIGKGRSQVTTLLYTFVMRNQKMPVLLASGTIIRSSPWNLHTALALTGRFIPLKDFQSKFFYLDMSL